MTRVKQKMKMTTTKEKNVGNSNWMVCLVGIIGGKQFCLTFCTVESPQYSSLFSSCGLKRPPLPKYAGSNAASNSYYRLPPLV